MKTTEIGGIIIGSKPNNCKNHNYIFRIISPSDKYHFLTFFTFI